MTVDVETSRISYVGSGTTGPFSVPFLFLNDEDLKVVKTTIADGTETTLTLTTDYTLTGEGDEDGGTLTLISSISSSYRLTILLDPDLLQETEYPRSDPFPTAATEHALDYAMNVAKRNRDLVSRSLRFSDGVNVSGVETALPAVEAAAYLRVTADGLGFEWVSDIDPADSSATFLQSGTGAVARTWTAKAAELVSVKDFGALGDGSTDDTTAVSNWLQYCATNNKRGFVPAGIYMVNPRISATGVTRLAITGDGPTTAVFKAIDGSAKSSNDEMFHLTPSASGAEVFIDGVGFDHNAANSPMPLTVSAVVGTFVVGETITGGTSGATATVKTVAALELGIHDFMNVDFTAGETITGGTSGATATAAALSLFLWQQSHTIRFNTSGVRSFERVMISNVWFNDPVADCLGFGGSNVNTYGDILINNMLVTNRGRVRSDITVTGCYDRLAINNFIGARIETEINSYSSSHLHETTITNALCSRGIDLYAQGANAASVFPPLHLSNVTAYGYVNLGEYWGRIDNFNFELNSAIRFIKGKWEFQHGRIYAGRNGASYADPRAIYYDASGTNPRLLKFDDVRFEANALSVSITHYFIDANSFGSSSTSQEPNQFINCQFKGSAVKTASIRSGQHYWLGCVHEYAGAAIEVGNMSAAGITNEIVLRDNRVTNASGYLIQPDISGNECAYKMRGNVSAGVGQIVNFTRYDKILSNRGGSGTQQNFVTVDDVEIDSIPTTGKWVVGQRAFFRDPATEGWMGALCTTSGNGDGTSATGSTTGALFTRFGKLGPMAVCSIEDDFLGDVLADQWGSAAGTDPQVVAPAISAATGGMVRMVTGDDAAADMATNGVQLHAALNWFANKAGLAFEARVKISAITSIAIFVGFTDQVAALEMPATLSVATFTYNATDAVGFLFDTAATTDTIRLVGVANGTPATEQDSSLAYVADTYRTLRVDITSAGVATFRIDGKVIGTAMTGAVTVSVGLTPVIAAFSRSAASRNIDCDYVALKQKR